MLERFTEKAVNVVSESQRLAKEMNCSEVCPEHLLLALASEAKGVSLKIFRMYDITPEKLQDAIKKYVITSSKKYENIPFSHSVKEILKHTMDLASKSGNQAILFEHLFLALITDKNSNVQSILTEYDFDVLGARELLGKLVQKKIKRLEHPESTDIEEKDGFEASYEGEALSDVFDRAVSKLSTSGYEILGTEQILASILETVNSDLTNTLNEYGLTSEKFEERVKTIGNRSSEFEGKKIIFTPNAFYMMNKALEVAKELGSSVVTPEHIVLGILNTKKGLAYEIIKSFDINDKLLAEDILRPIEKQMPETLLIMKLAKEETRRIGRNVVGTEMFLLGILAEGTNMAAKILNDLDITIKDARQEIEGLIGYGNEYFDKEIIFTNRAKRVLEKAWLRAKKNNKQRIESQDLLLAILDEPDSIAMKVLDNMGVDASEIRHIINSK